MLFDIERVKKNKIRSRETRPKNFLLKRVISDIENRILDLPNKWEHGLIEGCRRVDLKELKNNKNLNREGSIIVINLSGPANKPLIIGID